MHANKNGFFCEWYEFYAGTTFLGTKVDPRSIQPAIPPHPASWPPWGSDRFIALALVRHGRHLPPMSSAAGGGVLRDPGQPGGACLQCAGTGSTARPPSSPRCCRRMPWPGLCGTPHVGNVVLSSFQSHCCVGGYLRRAIFLSGKTRSARTMMIHRLKTTYHA